MVKLTVFIGHPDNPESFEKKFFDDHFPKYLQVPQFEKIEITQLTYSPLRIVENVDPAPPYYLQLELYFKNFDTYRDFWDSERGMSLFQEFLQFQLPFDFVVGQPILFTRGDIVETYNQFVLNRKLDRSATDQSSSF